ILVGERRKLPVRRLTPRVVPEHDGSVDLLDGPAFGPRLRRDFPGIRNLDTLSVPVNAPMMERTSYRLTLNPTLPQGRSQMRTMAVEHMSRSLRRAEEHEILAKVLEVLDLAVAHVSRTGNAKPADRKGAERKPGRHVLNQPLWYRQLSGLNKEAY